MGLGIEKSGIYTTYSIPFFSGDDANWEDNTWLVQHLRQLAGKIEEMKPRIVSVGLHQLAGYGATLEVKVLDKSY